MTPKPPTRNILISFDISSIAGRDQLAGVLRYLRGKPGWTPRLISRAGDLTPELIRNAGTENVDGIIINHAGSAESEVELARSDIPLAVVGIRNRLLSERTKAIAFIRNDNVETGRIAAKHFLSLGNFRAYGYIPSSPATEEWSTSRVAGFRSELARHGVEVDEFVHAGGPGSGDYFHALSSWLGALPKPAAVLAAWDYPAMQALEICRSEKIKVPHDLAVLGVDNDPIVCDATTPPLSSVPFDYEKQGFESAAALEALLARSHRRERPIVVACQPLPVFVRESAARIAPASELIKRALRIIARDAVKGASASDVARELGVSHGLLDLRFREFASTTVTDALIATRLEKTKLLLETTNRTIREITAASGFRNANYLKNLFKRRFGTTMRDFRENARRGRSYTA